MCFLPAPFSPSRGMNFAGQHIKIDVIARRNTGESFGDAAHLHMVNSRRAGGEEFWSYWVSSVSRSVGQVRSMGPVNYLVY